MLIFLPESFYRMNMSSSKMITNKQIGIILVIIGLVLTILTSLAKEKEDFYIDTLIEENDGVCVLENDYCLHQDRKLGGYIVGWVMGGSTIILGLYLLLFDKSHQQFTQQQEKFTKELKEAKKKDEFAAYVAGFSEDEQSVLKAIKEQDGIKQSTLRFRTGISKATLSLMLKQLEEKKVISRKVSGKTKEVYLQKKF